MAPSNSAKSLGVIFDSSFNLSENVSVICTASFYDNYLYNNVSSFETQAVRHCLSRKTSNMLANALVSGKLDDCNSLLSGVTTRDLRRLQLVQNALCRFVCRPS